MKFGTQLFRLAPIFLASFFASQQSQAANLVTNGSFEGLLVANQSYSAGTTLPGWTVTSGNIDMMCWESQDGACHIDLLGSFYPGTISQTIATIVDQEYKLSFYWAPSGEWMCTSYQNDGAVKGLNVSIDGASTATFTKDSSQTSPCWKRDWELTELTFKATSTSTSLAFSAWNQSGVYGAYLDNVWIEEKVSEVPLPGTLGLLGIGLAALGITRRRTAA